MPTRVDALVNGAVTASTQEAADAGAQLLRAGGNAVDAAIAAAFATCVADPSNAGIGGYGGYLLVQRLGSPARCVQFPLCAPSNRSPGDLAQAYPDTGPACSSVPNVVGGLSKALHAFGSVEWSAVLRPAIRLAHEGVTANTATTRALDACRSDAFVSECFVLHERVGNATRRVSFRQLQLAATLESLAEHGPEWFYAGPIAAAAWRRSREAGAAIPWEDWPRQAETVEVVDAAIHACGDLMISGAPLGLTGSACVFAMMVAASRIARDRPLAEAEAMLRLAAAMARVWQYRFTMPSGNDFAGVDIDAWIERALRYTADEAFPVDDLAHTAHVNAVDASGTMVALTFTHGHARFGGRWAVPGTGVIMNSGLHNFRFPGLVGRGGRWFGVSNMAPTIAADRVGNRVAVGCPGARRIPSNVAMMLAWRYCAGFGLQQAVSAGRIHAENRASVSCEVVRLGGRCQAMLGRGFGQVENESGENYFGPLTAIGAGPSGIEMGLDDRLFRGFGAQA